MHSFAIIVLVAMTVHASVLSPRNSSTLAGRDARPATRTVSYPKRETHAKHNNAPTPQPTGRSSDSNTIHISDSNNFALILPSRVQELISDSEGDGVAFCTPNGDGTCPRRMEKGFITGAAVEHAEDGSWIQVTGCLNPQRSHLRANDDGGQYDVRYPNGAKCTFGGYRASFIEQVEPSAHRFCLRCCKDQGDQVNCNSHNDRGGCLSTIPGKYSFDDGVDCSS